MSIRSHARKCCYTFILFTCKPGLKFHLAKDDEDCAGNRLSFNTQLAKFEISFAVIRCLVMVRRVHIMFIVPPCYSFLQTPQSQQPVRHQRPHQFQPQLKHQVGGVLRVKLYIILALSRPEYSNLIGWLLLWYLSYHSVHVFPSNTSSSWSCGQYQCKLYVYHMLHLFWYLYWHGTFGCFMWWYIIRKHP